MLTVDLARAQFASTTVYHFLFVPVTIGLAFFVAILQTVWHRSGDPGVRRLTPLLRHSPAYQRGHRGGDRSRSGVRVRDELVGLFPVRRRRLWRPPGHGGLGRLFPGIHLSRALWSSGGTGSRKASTWPVSGSSPPAQCSRPGSSWLPTRGCSTQWVTPSTRRPASAELNNIGALFTNPVFLWGYTHVLLASAVTGSLVMLAVSAWHLRRGSSVAAFTHTARISLVVLLPAIILAMFVGSELGVIEAKYQPMKIAAAEAQWTNCQPCSFSMFQVGGGNDDQTPTQIIEIPHLLSLLATNHWNGAGRGPHAPQPAVPKGVRAR